MTRFGWLMTTVMIVLSAAVLLLAVVWTSHKPVASPVTSATTTNSVPLTDPSTLAIYTSGTYGFSFFYPATATVTDQFTQTRVTQLSWRENPVATGTLVARVGVQDGEVRVGVSQAAKEISACTKNGPAEQKLTNTELGSTTWSTFSFDKLGTDTEQHVTSYRAVHDGSCFALEAFEPRVGASTTTQRALESIIQNFTFAK